jgi:MarR family transcriptional regulator for hemolysin
MPFRAVDHTGVLIKKAARLFEQVANKDLDKLGVTYAQTIFLIRLWEKDGQNQMELAKSAGLKQPTVVRTLDRMERDDLVKRVRNTEDRRVFNFYLPPKAKKACQKLEGHANTMNHLANKSIPKKDVEKLNQLILNVIQNLQDYLEN